MLNAHHYSAAGEKRASAFALPEALFDGTVNEPVLHQAVKAFLNNQRQGTASTKTRSFVSGGNQKPWKQKGTGRARAGSTRAPHWRGGGTVFGPHPRDYTTEVPKKVKQLARKSALNARAREEAFHVVERFALTAPKTQELLALLTKLGVAGRKVLLLTASHNEPVYLSSRNLQKVQVLRWSDASAYDILQSEHVIVEEGALTGHVPEAADEVVAAPAPRSVKKAAAETKVKAAKKATKAAAKDPAAKAAKKTATKKPKGDA
jgi:large subunit ribosomal protein L4